VGKGLKSIGGIEDPIPSVQPRQAIRGDRTFEKNKKNELDLSLQKKKLWGLGGNGFFLKGLQEQGGGRKGPTVPCWRGKGKLEGPPVMKRVGGHRERDVHIKRNTLGGRSRWGPASKHHIAHGQELKGDGKVLVEKMHRRRGWCT